MPRVFATLLLCAIMIVGAAAAAPRRGGVKKAPAEAPAEAAAEGPPCKGAGCEARGAEPHPEVTSQFLEQLVSLGIKDHDVPCSKRGTKKRQRAITKCHKILTESGANMRAFKRAEANADHAQAYTRMHTLALEWLSNHSKHGVESDEGSVVWWTGATVEALASAVRCVCA